MGNRNIFSAIGELVIEWRVEKLRITVSLTAISKLRREGSAMLGERVESDVTRVE